jgi:ribosome-associated heat shock protein Hsp15
VAGTTTFADSLKASAPVPVSPINSQALVGNTFTATPAIPQYGGVTLQYRFQIFTPAGAQVLDSGPVNSPIWQTLNVTPNQQLAWKVRVVDGVVSVGRSAPVLRPDRRLAALRHDREGHRALAVRPRRRAADELGRRSRGGQTHCVTEAGRRRRPPDQSQRRQREIRRRRLEYSAVTDRSDDSLEPRLDVWLDVACLFRTRSEAQAACRNGRLLVNGQVAKANRRLRVGDEIQIGRPFGRKQRLIVRGLAERHVPKAEARTLYEDLTPPPTPEEIEVRKLERMYRAATTPPRAPDKRQRRALRRMKGRED